MLRGLSKAGLVVIALLLVSAPALAANGALSWPAAPGATGYDVQGCAGVVPACGAADPGWLKLNPAPVTTLSFAESNLPLNTRLCRRIVPVNAFGAGPISVIMCDSGNTPGPLGSGAIIWTLSPGP